MGKPHDILHKHFLKYAIKITKKALKYTLNIGVNIKWKKLRMGKCIIKIYTY